MPRMVQKYKQYLLTGVSHVVPLIACGGILIAVSIALSPMTVNGPDIAAAPVLVQKLMLVGETAFSLFPAVLAAFISYAMAGKPGLVPGFVGGAIASMPQQVGDKSTTAGFLGALLIGLLAGHAVNLLKKLKVPKFVRPVMPVSAIPIISSVVVGFAMMALNLPLARVMVGMGSWLEAIHSGPRVVLALILGAMIAFDMGGPVNKAAFFFGAAMIKEGNFAVMGACAAAICVPPLGLGLATLLKRDLWSEQEREAGIAALGMGMMGITEGAIPFAAAAPLRVIPCIMAGSMVASAIAMLGGVGGHAPHGGPIVLPVVDNRIMFMVAIVTGAAVTALAINMVKRLAYVRERVNHEGHEEA